MKNHFRSLIMALIGVSMLASCNSLEVTMPVGPRGEQGIQGVAGKDGLSAYELWVKAVHEKQIDYTGSVDISHFFLYLKGKDGVDGKDGKDGKDGADGVDGANGKSAYELWKEYVTTGSMILTILEVNGIKPRHRWWISIGSLRETMARMDLSHISRMETGGLEIMTPESKPKVTRATKVIPEIKVIRVIKEILEPKEIRVIKETKAIKVIRAIPVFPAKWS